MTKQEYINSLSVDELRAIAGEFYHWCGDDGCPMTHDKDFPCAEGRGDDEIFARNCQWDEGEQAESGCWLKYYVWKFRKKQEKK